MLFREPAGIFAEIAWRWIFGISALLLTGLAILRIGRSVAIFPEEDEMLASRSPILIAQAVLEIGHRIWPVVIRVAAIVIPAILVLWVIAATVGRGYVMNRLLERETRGPNWIALALLNILRVISVLLLAAAYFGCSFATSLINDPSRPNYALAILVFLALFVIALIVWSLLHWILATACIYAGRQHLGLRSALHATMQLLRSRAREVFSISAQNSSIRTLAALLYTFLALLPLVILRIPPLFWTLEIVLFLAYCILSDVLLLARLVAYLELTEQPAGAVESATQI
ncbi:MAG: hypothetical protein ACM3JB_22805 [Acidobacteriaceae bacterium]